MKNLAYLIAAALPALADARAATLTAVPMGGAMVHANILYDAAAARIDVHVEPTVPLLCPLDYTNPADNFAPEDPWFACLDPSEAGLAFNRQYGLVVDAATDPLPATMGIWIRLVTADPELEFYRYRSSAGSKSWEPMFGTAGATNLFAWNLMMFHPGVAAIPGDRTNRAVFEAFAVNLATGLPDDRVAPGRFSLVWKVVPSARPSPELSPGFVLSWPPTTEVAYVPQWSDQVAGGTWTDLTAVPVLKEGKLTLQLNPGPEPRFYRLKRLP